MRVLLVEDDNLTRLGLAEVLEMYGERVATAVSGAHALALAEGGPTPDAIVLDYYLEDTDGLSLLGKLRAVPKLSGVPVVFLTAANDRLLAEFSAKLSAAGGGRVKIVRKPCDPAELLALLHEMAEV